MLLKMLQPFGLALYCTNFDSVGVDLNAFILTKITQYLIALNLLHNQTESAFYYIIDVATKNSTAFAKVIREILQNTTLL